MEKLLQNINYRFFILLLLKVFLLPLFLESSPKISTTDSLNIALQKAKDDSTKLEIYKKFIVYWKNKNTDKAIYYANHALNKAIELQDYYNISSIKQNIGSIQVSAGNNNEAIKHLRKALSIAKKHNFFDLTAYIYNDLGHLFITENDYEKALEHFFMAIEANEKTDNKADNANYLNNIAIIYRRMGDLNKAIQYHKQSYDIYKNTGNLKGRAIIYNNIGIIYYQEDNPHMALNNFNKAAQIRKDLGNYSEYGNILFNISYILHHTGNHAEAKEKCLKSLSQARSVGSLPLEHSCYILLVDVLEKMGNYKQAYDYHKKLVMVADSLFDIEKQKQIIELRSQYLVDKERYEIDLLEKENELTKKNILKLNYYLVSSAVLLVFLLVLTGVIIYNNRVKTKNNNILEDKNRIISEQKKEDLYQKDKIKQYNEQQKLQEKEILKQSDVLKRKKNDLEKAVLSLEKKNKKIKSSLKYAGSLQKTMKPQIEKPLYKCFKDAFIYQKQFHEVFNCCYWTHLTKKYCYLAIADTKNNDITGTFICILLNDLLNKFVKRNNDDVSIIKLIHDIENEYINTDNKDKAFISKALKETSICILKIDLYSYHAAFASKNMPVIHVTNGKAMLIGHKQKNYNEVYKASLSMYSDDILIIPNRNALQYLIKDQENLKPSVLKLLTENNLDNDSNRFKELKNFLNYSLNNNTSVENLSVFGIKM